MTFFSEELAGSSAAPSLDVEGEDTMSEESNKGVGENRSESIGKKGGHVRVRVGAYTERIRGFEEVLWNGQRGRGEVSTGG